MRHILVSLTAALAVLAVAPAAQATPRHPVRHVTTQPPRHHRPIWQAPFVAPPGCSHLGCAWVIG
jgi:hypothetical protein